MAARTVSFLAIAVALLWAAASAQAFDHWSVEPKATIGCAQAGDVSELKLIVAQGDREAYLDGAVKAVQEGRCRVLERGVALFVMERRDQTYLTRVREKGRPETWWVHTGELLPPGAAPRD